MPNGNATEAEFEIMRPSTPGEPARSEGVAPADGDPARGVGERERRLSGNDYGRDLLRQHLLAGWPGRASR